MLRREKGRLGISLFFATRGWSQSKFNSGSGKCPFLRRDGLCDIQKKRGHDHIPWTCQSYPRFYRNYGDFEECCLDLSCIGAARLFMKHSGEAHLTVTEGEPHTRVCTTNDDSDYLEFLLRIRSGMMDATEAVLEDTQEGKQSPSAAFGIYADALFLFAQDLQEFFSKGGQDLPSDLSFTTFMDGRVKDAAGKPFSLPLPARVLKGFLDSSLNHVKLRRINPRLYRLFKKAGKAAGNYMKSEGAWEMAACDVLDAQPLLYSTLVRYLSYYLLQYFLRAYETYSFRRQTALGLCHMNMVLLLIMTEAEEKEITEDMLADVIALYNRRAFFNDDIQDEMHRIFENGFLDHEKRIRS